MTFDFGDNKILESDFGNELSSQAQQESNPLEFCRPIPLKELNMNVGPREWIYGTSLVRGMLSLLGGPGGVGKSKYMLKVLLSIALNRPLLALRPDEPEHTIYEPCGRVWYYSLEDPMDELIRSIKAEILHHMINPHTIWDRVFLQSGRDNPLIVAKMVNGEIVRCDVEPIIRHITQSDIVAAAADPFANSFEGGEGAESGSDAMKIILDQWRIIAHEANVPIWLAHHFRKGGAAGDADAFRGSSVIQNAARVMETLTRMTTDQAKALGIAEEDRRRFVRLENAKVNLTEAPADGQWFRIHGVPLGNRTEKYPKGDLIGVMTRWKPTEKVLTWQQVETILTRIEHDEPNGMFFSSAKQNSYWAGGVIMSVASRTEDEAAAMLKEWIKAGLLSRGSYTSPKTGKLVEKLDVDASARARLRRQIEGDGEG
jgi:hypothetical protein